jgi:hypothetical protein
MSQIKFSQKSIQGLPEALAALLAQLNAQGSAGSTALTTAINAEIAARQAADTTISNLLDTVNGDSTVNGSFRKAIADVIGSAPEALNTLKEIADYISVNPEANVADAINAAIAAAQQAVTDLTAVVTAEKTYLDAIVGQTEKFGTCNRIIGSDWDAHVDNYDEGLFEAAGNGTISFHDWVFGGYEVGMILNYGRARLTTPAGLTVEVEISTHGLDLDAAQWNDLGNTLDGVRLYVQYTYFESGSDIRTALGG